MLTKKFTNLLRKKVKGFSLIELSIVIAIVSIIITSFVTLATSRSVNQKASSGTTNIDAIYQALGKYLLANKSLPCPASLTDLKNSSSTYGQSSSCAAASGVYVSSNLVYGMVPTKTLGLDNNFAEDAYGNKIVYIVDSRLTSAGNTFEANIGNSTLVTVSSASVANALFVLMSRGANGSGAFGVNSSATPTASSDSNELFNDAASLSSAHIMQTAGVGAFDDLVFYKTEEQMFNDFPNAWSFIPCQPEAPLTSLYCGLNNGTTDHEGFVWPKAYPGQIVSTEDGAGNCPEGWNAGPKYPTKKCGAKGVWESGIVDNCVANNALAATCYVGACLRNSSTINSGAQFNPDRTTDDGYVANGSSISLLCNDGYGKAIQADTWRNLSYHETYVCRVQNDGVYGFDTTDRIASLPTATCNNGAWTITNPCSSCRECSSTANGKVYTVEHEIDNRTWNWNGISNYQPMGNNPDILINGACYGKYDSSSNWSRDYDCYYIPGLGTTGCDTWSNPHSNSYPLPSSGLSGVAHLQDQSEGKHLSHGNDSSGASWTRCLDGRFYGLLGCTGNDNFPSTPSASNNFGTIVDYEGTACDYRSFITANSGVSTSFKFRKSGGCGTNQSVTLMTPVVNTCSASQYMIGGQTYTCSYSDSGSINNGISCKHSYRQTTYYTFTCLRGVKTLTSSSCSGDCGSGNTTDSTWVDYDWWSENLAP